MYFWIGRSNNFTHNSVARITKKIVRIVYRTEKPNPVGCSRNAWCSRLQFLTESWNPRLLNATDRLHMKFYQGTNIHGLDLMENFLYQMRQVIKNLSIIVELHDIHLIGSGNWTNSIYSFYVR